MNTTKTNIRKNTRKPQARRTLLIGVLALAIIVGVLLALELSNTTHIFHSSPVVATAPTASESTKGEPSVPSTNKSTQGTSTQNASSSTGTTTSTAQPGDQKSDAGGNTAVVLIAPSGDFVSAHHVTTTSSLTSVCNTSPGVNCTITFTSNGMTKSLSTETTDRGGSAYWNNWTPKSIGLSVGTWTVQAVATSGSQTQTGTDATSFEVTQ